MDALVDAGVRAAGRLSAPAGSSRELHSAPVLVPRITTGRPALSGARVALRSASLRGADRLGALHAQGTPVGPGLSGLAHGAPRQRAAASSGAAESPLEPSEGSSGEPEGLEDASPPPTGRKWWQVDSAELRAKVAKLGLAAVLGYGLFDGVTYTTFFVLAFLGYEKSTGLNPAANLKALLGIVVLMWTGNNVTRPFRVAGAAALAPALDEGLNHLQKALRLPSQFLAFLLVVVSFASICLSIVGLLILSRWGK